MITALSWSRSSSGGGGVGTSVSLVVPSSKAKCQGGVFSHKHLSKSLLVPSSPANCWGGTCSDKLPFSLAGATRSKSGKLLAIMCSSELAVCKLLMECLPTPQVTPPFLVPRLLWRCKLGLASPLVVEGASKPCSLGMVFLMIIVRSMLPVSWCMLCKAKRHRSKRKPKLCYHAKLQGQTPLSNKHTQTLEPMPTGIKLKFVQSSWRWGSFLLAKIHKFQLSFFCLFLLFQQQKTPNLLKPLFS